MSLLTININYKNRHKNVNAIIYKITDKNIKVFLEFTEKKLKELKDETN